jgi:hypothetical protein
MRSKTVDRILKSISPERRKEIDDMLESRIEKIKMYQNSLSDGDKFVAIVESEDFNSELMGSILHDLYDEFPIELYGYRINEFDTGLEPAYYFFTKQN